jgi:RES domain-containing protein
VYTSGSKALALLEILVHLDPIDAPPRWVAFRFDIAAEQIEKPELPSGWATQAGRTRRVGDAWLSSRRTLALAVPSVIVPEELNCLLNPLHPDFARLEAGPPLPFTLDFRLSN